MSASGIAFLDGLSWYLETRQWAREKIDTCPHGSKGQDIKMFHYLYFANLFSAIDLVDDYLVAAEGGAKFMRAEVQQNFTAPSDFDYALQLRNAIVHRGLDPATAGHSDNQLLFVLCPTGIRKKGGAMELPCTFTYTKELAAECDRAANAAIFQAINQRGFLIEGQFATTPAEHLAAIDASTVMPDWAKIMARSALSEIDFEALATDLDANRVAHIRQLLGASGDIEVEPA